MLNYLNYSYKTNHFDSLPSFLFLRENTEDLRFIALKRKGFQLHPPRRQLYSVRVLQLVYIPGLGNESTQAQRAGFGLKGRLLLDLSQ